jgi:hypothetical protein
MVKSKSMLNLREYSAKGSLPGSAEYLLLYVFIIVYKSPYFMSMKCQGHLKVQGRLIRHFPQTYAAGFLRRPARLRGVGAAQAL